jgi:hypothetical protein
MLQMSRCPCRREFEEVAQFTVPMKSSMTAPLDGTRGVSVQNERAGVREQMIPLPIRVDVGRKTGQGAGRVAEETHAGLILNQAGPRRRAKRPATFWPPTSMDE